ncbi:hypothetical protein CFC21_008269 [Triticum aestivum]|uniref:Uncharacterized protein n=3 Tax=Triticum TaxID=4564 RepID=A0A9R1DG27_WHEAT|nr:hypothetical protein CFC21_008266 [Triticum aestivum]KAF6991155.1 hypothetical protein CFC21_008269 [Triticum aestivum]VAH21305.1 unnamed protein product [Triticum turgidum subsp. durum]
MEALSHAVRSGTEAGMEVEQILSLAANHVNDNADLACHALAQSGIPADAVLSAAMKTGLKAREEVYATLLEQLLASFAEPSEDTQLREWGWPPKPQYSFTEKRSGPRVDPKQPFFLISMKASAETARISWSMKKYPRYPRDRAWHNPLRVARLGTGAEGFRVEQAGQGGQPGALSSFIDVTYSGWPRPKEGIFEEGSSVPLREVAVIKRLPGGDGISVMSYVHGLGVKLDDILLVLHVPSAAVPLRFTEQSFYVSENFEEIPMYAPTGLDFIDINAPVKNLIKKLYQLYLQEEQEKNSKPEKQGHRGSEELVYRQEEEFMLQRHETEEEKLERLRGRREESKKHRDLRKEMKEAVHRIKDAARTSEEEEHQKEYDPMLLPFLFQEECGGLVKPLEELSQSGKRHDGSLVEVVEQQVSS